MGKPQKKPGAGGTATAAQAAGQAAGSTDQAALQAQAGADQSIAGQGQSSNLVLSQLNQPGTVVADESRLSQVLAPAGDVVADGHTDAQDRGFYRPPGVGLKVSSLVDGYRRAGRAWSRTPEIIPLSDLSDEQITILRSDAEIRIEPVELQEGKAD